MPSRIMSRVGSTSTSSANGPIRCTTAAGAYWSVIVIRADEVLTLLTLRVWSARVTDRVNLNESPTANRPGPRVMDGDADDSALTNRGSAEQAAGGT